MKTLAVTWGFHTERELKKSQPTSVAKNIKMVYKQLEQLNNERNKIFPRKRYHQ